MMMRVLVSMQDGCIPGRRLWLFTCAHRPIDFPGGRANQRAMKSNLFAMVVAAAAPAWSASVHLNKRPMRSRYG